ncbi:MAG: hypothetical protein ACLQPD_30250 [Desulfomonilaceae bacterium]
MAAESSGSDLVQMFDHVNEWASTANNYGPFFFGVFLVVLAFALIILDKNRWICLLIAVCGILFMAWASLLFSGIGRPIYAYTMRIDNLAKNHSLALTESVPRLYRHNVEHDTEGDSYHVDLVTVSPVKLEKGYEFRVIIKEGRTLMKPDGTTELSDIKYRLIIPFKGEADSTYDLQPIESKDEEGLVRYKIAKNTCTEERKNISSWLQRFLSPIAHANEIPRHVPVSTSSFTQQIAQSGAESVRGDGTAKVFREGDTSLNVIYFERPADQGKVRKALSTAGISYAIETSLGTDPTNAVWVGREVSSKVAERIVKSLLAEGVDLRYFGYFRDLDAKTNVVQIGYSESNANNNTITMENVLSFTQDLLSKQRSVQELRLQQQKNNQFLQEKILQQQRQQQQQQRIR